MESLVHTLLSNALAATVLAVIAAGLSRIGRRPAITHGLWLIVLLKLVTPPLVPIAIPGAPFWPAGSNLAIPAADSAAVSLVPVERLPLLEKENTLLSHTDISSSEMANDSTPAVAILTHDDDVAPRFSEPVPSAANTIGAISSSWSWEHVLLVGISIGALGWWILASLRIVQFQRLLNDARPVPAEWQFHTDALAERLGLGWKPAVFLVPGRVPPMLWAIGGEPRVLVPSQLWAEMGEAERTSLVLHELAHLKRRDHWVRWLELVVLGLYWWLPVAWWARRALREAEEQCCDAWVVWAMPQRARTYAAALLAAVEFVSGYRTAPAAASATSGSGHVSCLKRRLRMIVRAKTPKGLSWAGRIAVLGTAALFLPLAPSWARNGTAVLIDSSQPTGVDEKPLTEKTVPTAISLAERHDVSLKQRQIEKLMDAMVATDLELFEAQSMLEVKQQLLSQAERGEDEQSPREKVLLARITEEFKKDGEVQALLSEIQELNMRHDHAKNLARHLDDPARKTVREELAKRLARYDALWQEKYQEIRDRLTSFDSGKSILESIDELKFKVDTLTKKKEKQAALFGQIRVDLTMADDDKDAKDDDNKQETTRDAAEQIQEQLKDLIGKLGKQLTPVTEEIRKALERAVGDVHQSLEKEGLSAEELGKALERSQEDLRKSFENGGAINKELRDAIEHSRDEIQKALDRVKGSVRDQVETLKDKSRDLADQARDDLARAKESVEKDTSPGQAPKDDRSELEATRKQIRELEQLLRKSTRRLEELERRETRRVPAPRRERMPRGGFYARPKAESAPEAAPAPEVAPVPPQPPRGADAPAPPREPDAPAPPPSRRPSSDARPGPAGGRNVRRTPQANERRIQQLEERMKSLLKELESLKEEKSSSPDKQSNSRDTRPAQPGERIID